MAFSPQFLDELAARNDIESIVSQYVSLKRQGGKLWGLCPFHNEKTASFSVTTDKQLFYCFGCGKGGGVIHFIMEAEQLTFPDAVRFLAARAGMTLPDESAQDKEQREVKFQLLRTAARFFHQTLFAPEGAAALAYVEKRGISKGAISRFGLGAAPDKWDALITYLQREGFHEDQMLDTGVIVRGKTGNLYDRFRGRLIFPIINVRGQVIGFGGRVLDDSLPKYLNSPESSVFNKRRNLFALNLAKKTKRDHIIVTEGYMDALALHQAGFDCAVASLGTALTPEHGKLLSQYTKEVILAYDGDTAGVNAATRAIAILEQTGLSVKVLQMQGAKDPDEFIQKHGPAAFDQLLRRSDNHMEYQLMQIKGRHTLDTSEGKLAFLKEAAAFLATLPGPVEREVYGGKAAELAGVSPQSVMLEVARARKARAKQVNKQETRRSLAPAQLSQPKDRELRYENVRSALAEEGVLRFLFLDDSMWAYTDGLTPEDFSVPLLGRMYQLMEAAHGRGDPVSIGVLSGELTPQEMSHGARILEKPASLSEGVAAMKDYIDTIRTQQIKRTAPTEDDLLLVQTKYREKKGYGGNEHG